MSGWWDRASIEQRLVQVDAGIELGMTALQIALASGFRDGLEVGKFALNHARHIGRRGKTSTRLRANGVKLRAKWAYDHGEPVDFWSETPRADLDEAA